jgi:tellurite resistance protein
VDEALVAVLIAAMNANQHVSPAEAERAHNIIWSTRRFRRKSGEAVGRLIQDTRALIEADGEPVVVARAARVIPGGLRAPAFAVAVDLVLEDGRLEREERQFLKDLARELGVDAKLAQDIVRVILIKNGA